MTVKDPVAVLEPKSGAAKAGRRDAIGAEIPVTVHASRTNQGLGKNLPPVHEDTKTVIVLQQGAVVRLTASLMTGETVVLTNRMTSADVLCRVGNIKSQPGIQHYVDLEFIQRAPGFWGDTAAASNAHIATEAPAAVPPASPAPPAPIVVPVAVLPPPVPVSIPALPPPPAAVAAPPAPSPVLVAPPPPPPPPPQVADWPPAPDAQAHQLAPLAEPVSVSSKASQAGSVMPIRSGASHALGSISAEGESYRAPRSHKALLGTAAAVLLLAGAAGGYWFYGRQAATSPPVPQQAAYVPPVPAMPDPVETSEAIEPESDVLAPSPGSQMDVFIETHPSVDAPAVAAPAAPTAAARTSPAAARPLAARPPAPVVRRNTVPIGQLQAPKAKTTATRMDANEPPPVIMGALSLGDTGTADALLAAEPAGPAPPPVKVNSQPTVGGQLQQPQLISSTAPVYPPNARMQRIQGVVVLDALVDETGKVVETNVIAGPAPLLSAAQQAVRGWKYRPAQLNGKPIAVHTKVSVRFALQ